MMNKAMPTEIRNIERELQQAKQNENAPPIGPDPNAFRDLTVNCLSIADCAPAHREEKSQQYLNMYRILLFADQSSYRPSVAEFRKRMDRTDVESLETNMIAERYKIEDGALDDLFEGKWQDGAMNTEFKRWRDLVVDQHRKAAQLQQYEYEMKHYPWRRIFPRRRSF